MGTQVDEERTLRVECFLSKKKKRGVWEARGEIKGSEKITTVLYNLLVVCNFVFVFTLKK